MTIKERIEEAAQKMLKYDNYETLMLPAMLTEAIIVITELEERVKKLEEKNGYSKRCMEGQVID